MISLAQKNRRQKSPYDNSLEFLQTTMRLQSIFFDGGSLDDFITATAEELGNPLCLVDTSFKVISLYPSKNIYDSVWASLVVQGFVNDEYLKEDVTEHISESARGSRFPISYERNNDFPPRIIGGVICDGKPIASLGAVQMKQPFKDRDPYLIDFACRVLGEELGKTKYAGRFAESRVSQMVYDILAMKPEDTRSIVSRLEQLKLPPATRRTACVLFPDSLLGLQDYIRRQIGLVIPEAECHTMPSGKELAVVWRQREQKPTVEQRLAGILSSYDLKAGISDAFDNLIELQEQYRCAKMALTHNPESPEAASATLRWFSDSRIELFFSNAALDVGKSHFCNPAILKMRDYDRQKDAQLEQTLRAFLENGCSMERTSQALFIHRNTLRYRIKRIEEICGLDLEDRSTQFDLWFSLRALDADRQ